ncbi:S-methyl-5-thioribose kinase [Alkalispirochaeta alkalica]|uniref:S-methyl-5-thioribose kinase n=1 Tax=Alkalispirochaeta alkalica TaxID=46356 RepID=UPI00047661B9|nr:S-methyl-5-thioribose kinase [Alkalispirochaeta alkalica]
MGYETLNEQTAAEYVQSKTSLFPKGADLDCREIGDGNLNMVFRVWQKDAAKQSVIIKQSLPHARIDESIVAPLERARIESEMLVLHDTHCPGLAPKIFDYDREMYAIIMEDLSDHVVLRKGLIAGTVYPKLGEHLGIFLARSLFFTSDLGMDPLKKKELQKSFVNPDLCKITEDLVFSNPYFNAENNKIDPEIRERAERNWRDALLKREVAKLKEKFMTQGQALVHGDLHTGSVFVTQDSTKAFDPEFAFYGPMGFDVGAIIGNLVLNHAAQVWHKQDLSDRKKFQGYLLETIREIWRVFDKEFRNLWNEHVHTPLESAPEYRDDYMKRLLSDSIGYAGCKMTRRIVGLAQVEDIRSIKDVNVRRDAQIAVLDTAREFILHREQLTSIDDVLEVIQKFAMP